MTDRRKAYSVLTMNTLAFTVCFACWMINGVLVTFLSEHRVFQWSDAQIGWLIGIPVLTGSLFRLPVGILTDRFGGRIVFGILMLISALPMSLLSIANSYETFLLASLGFGVVGASFAVGIAYTSVWFPPEKQGTALGIFGAGNAGAALTSMGAPLVLQYLTNGGESLEAWRQLPRYYAFALVAMTGLFFLFTYPRKVAGTRVRTLTEQLAPLKVMRVWRFGLYYFLVFGGFVALAQWLIPYYVSVYAVSIATAGFLAAIFSLPSGVIRALGGWMSDHWGARRVMYWVLGSCLVACALLVVPRMDIESPGRSVAARMGGTVTEVTEQAISVGERTYPLKASSGNVQASLDRPGTLILPTFEFYQLPVVKEGDTVKRKQLLARGVTHIYFQANIWIFTFLVFVVGFMMGIGKAAVYKHIPAYFPHDVGVVGGIVGVIGGLGGFLCPIFFGYMLEWTGIWTTCWIFFTALSVVCLWWMHRVIRRMMHREVPQLMMQLEQVHPAIAIENNSQTVVPAQPATGVTR
ncbi:MAG: NarK/NasA family nitrate transporter [Calditrichaeota bacterium]|nr:NarK/NasA family nitrate transporter [Calditrichota bacterium]